MLGEQALSRGICGTLAKRREPLRKLRKARAGKVAGAIRRPPLYRRIVRGGCIVAPVPAARRTRK